MLCPLLTMTKTRLIYQELNGMNNQKKIDDSKYVIYAAKENTDDPENEKSITK